MHVLLSFRHCAFGGAAAPVCGVFPGSRRSQGAYSRRTLCTAQPTQFAAGQTRRCDTLDLSSERHCTRRGTLKLALLLATTTGLGPALALGAGASTVLDGVEFDTLQNGTLAYAFQYPVQLPSGEKLRFLFTRKPEKYSSAAPLTPDARQRIVAELVDFRHNVTVSVSVGPPSPLFGLRKQAPEQWEAKRLVESILIDKTTSKVNPQGNRIGLNTIETITTETRADGRPYWVYEHYSQSAPTQSLLDTEGGLVPSTYRRALAVTTWRPGMEGTPYLYTLNLACLDNLWPDLQPQFQKAAATFHLTEQTRDYVPPDKDPWLFF